MNADPITAIQILGFQLSGMENNLEKLRELFFLCCLSHSNFFFILLVPKVFILWTILSRKSGFEPE